jgi:hypothetical protein
MNSRVDVLPRGYTGEAQTTLSIGSRTEKWGKHPLRFRKLIQQRDIYWRLLQPRYLPMVNVDPLGGICWPEGEDLVPDGLDRYIVSKGGWRSCVV